MHRHSVSQAKECTLKIRVLEATMSGEHKVILPPSAYSIESGLVSFIGFVSCNKQRFSGLLDSAQ